LTLKPTVQLTGHEEDVRVIAFTSDGKTIATGSNDASVRLYNASTGKELKVLKGHGGRVTALGFSADGKTLVTAAGDTVRLWAVPAGTAKGAFKVTQAFVQSIDISPDAKTVVVGDSEKNVTVWNTGTKKRLALGQGHQSMVLGVSFAPKQSVIASTDQDGKMRFWDAKTGKLKKEVQTGDTQIYKLQLAPDAKTAVTGFNQFIVQVDAASGDVKVLFDKARHEPSAYWFSEDGKALRVVDDTLVRSLDLSSLKAVSSELIETTGDSRGWDAGAFSADGKFAAFSIGAKTVQVVEIVEEK
jgi:tricorn protease-like protein